MVINPRFASTILVPACPLALHARALIIPGPSKWLWLDQIISRCLGLTMSRIGCPNATTTPLHQRHPPPNWTKHIPHERRSPRPLVPLPWMKMMDSQLGVYAVSSGNRLKQLTLPSLISAARYGTWLEPTRSNWTRTTGWWPTSIHSSKRSLGV
jgi:hypothetical protein